MDVRGGKAEKGDMVLSHSIAPRRNRRASRGDVNTQKED